MVEESGRQQVISFSFLAETPRTKAALTLLSIVTYIFLFNLLYPLAGRTIAALAILPTVFVGLFWGMRAALAMGILMVPLNILLFARFGTEAHSPLYLVLRGLADPGTAIVIIVGLVVGRLHDLGERLKSELIERTQAEQALKEASAQLAYQAQHDVLTGLPNRSLFEDRLQQALLHAQRLETLVAVGFIDLDRFKLVNDTYGHAVGDLLLQQIVQRLQTRLRLSDTLGRIGGDEFTLVLPNLKEPQDAARIAHDLLSLFEAPFVIDEQPLFVTASIGLSLYPSDGSTLQELVSKADQALYEVKHQGKNNIRLYSPTLNAASISGLTLEQDLRAALAQGDLILYFQPQLDGKTGTITTVEALTRWRHPTLGIVQAETFIHPVESSSFAVALGDWVLDEACRQLKVWHQAGFSTLRLAVNISAVQFFRPTFVETLLDTLQRHDLSPGVLELELSERLFTPETQSNAARLVELRQLGIHTAIDDFGSGHSSLRVLTSRPVNTIKIAPSFMGEIGADPALTVSAIGLLEALISLAHTLHMSVVAEGVETEAQLSVARRLQCDRLQGHLLSRPLHPDSIPAFLNQPHRAL